MDQLQTDIDSLDWDLDVQFLGVNEAGRSSGNGHIPLVSDLPWLQATEDQPVWPDWQVTYRDVIILDGENVPVAVFNVSTYNLTVQANYDSLKTLLRGIADAP